MHGVKYAVMGKDGTVECKNQEGCLMMSSEDMHVVEPSRGSSFIWQIGVNLSIQDQRQVDKDFYRVVRCNTDLAKPLTTEEE